jgi:ABC-type protease/lipase transport system fused ATPase/permease subunit
LLAGYISYILNNELKKEDKAYINNNLAKFFLFLRVLLNIICKLIVLHGIIGVGAYIVVSTNAAKMTVGEMFVSVIITNKLLNIFDNLAPRWKYIFSLSSKVLKN